MPSLPDYSARRLLKVIVRSIHLVGIAGVFGAAMMQGAEPVYVAMTVGSGLLLVLMEAFSGWLLWCVQLRGIAFYLKLLLLLYMHRYPETAVACLIAVIVLSGFISHAPSWIRYYSVRHGRVVHANDEILG